MLNIPYLAEALWVFPVVVHLYMIWRMSKSNLISSYPLFVFYCWLQAIRLVVMYPLYFDLLHYGPAYFYLFWMFEAFDVLVSIVIIREIYVRMFMPYEAIRRLGCALFNWAMGVLSLVCWYAALVSNSGSKDPWSRLAVGFDQASTFLRAGLILLLICIGLFFRINWSRLNFGIALGFFLFLMMNAAALAVLLQHASGSQTVYWTLRPAGYNAGAILWAWYFVRQPAEETKAVHFPSVDLARWNADLAEMMR